MTNGIGNVTGFGSGYPVGGYSNNNNNGTDKTGVGANPTPADIEATQVDPNVVMDFLAANNYFVNLVENNGISDLDDATRTRIEGYMENFDLIYSIIVEEFGEDLAPDVMVIAMNNLMNIAA